MTYGFHRKILRVNLSNWTISSEAPEEMFYRRYFGGTGLIAYYLLKEVPPSVDPLGPDNKLIFAPGIMTGVPFPGSGRNSVGAKSPLSGGFGDSQAGGFWGAELKRAGIDAIIVEGQANKPIYLWIKDGEVEIRRADHLWGKPTDECQKAIWSELGDEHIKVSQIGPGAEKLVRYGCITNDLFAFAGRTGIGAVMGSKRLKAIAVRGTGKVPVADKEKIRELGRWFGHNWKDLHWDLYDTGTAGQVEIMNTNSGLPTRNFSEGQFEGYQKLTGETMRNTILSGRESCFACPVHCKRKVEVNNGKYVVTPSLGGPEYETIGSFGSCCGVDDLEAVAKANEICNANTIDTISTGVTIAFAMECYEKGILGRTDTGGLKLNLGNAEALVELTRMIANREGLGDLLAEGAARAAEKIGHGASQYTMVVKNQEIPLHEPRFKWAMGIGYMISPTGADHVHNIHDPMYSQECPATSLGILEPVPVRDLGPKKIRILRDHSMWMHFANCAVFCIFPGWKREQIETLARAITGWDTSQREMLLVGERAATMARMFNIIQGFTAEDDSLPKRFYQAFTSGILKGVKFTYEEALRARSNYYESMGWDRQTGVPTDFRIHELDIEWIKYLKKDTDV